MSDTSVIGLPEAANRLGVPVRLLRRSIRAGHIPAPPGLTAVTPLTAEWLSGARAAVAASPGIFSAGRKQKVPAFARYKGTSAWTKYRRRVREVRPLP